MITKQQVVSAKAASLNKLFPDGQRGWEHVVGSLTASFDKPDIEAAQVLFASVAAHRIMDHPPTWNMLIAPSGSMKTALLNTLQGLPSIHTLDEVTENTFISGMLDKSRTGKKPKKNDPMPASLLNRIGDEGILVVPDFSTILAMNKNKQPVILSQLRRIYDGSFNREFGTAENLADRKWQGRITLLAGVTPELDKYHSVFQALGERFVRTRWPRAGGIDAALRAMRQKTNEAELIKVAVHSLLRPVMEAKSILGAPNERRRRTSHCPPWGTDRFGADLCQSRTLHARYPRRTRSRGKHSIPAATRADRQGLGGADG